MEKRSWLSSAALELGLRRSSPTSGSTKGRGGQGRDRAGVRHAAARICYRVTRSPVQKEKSGYERPVRALSVAIRLFLTPLEATSGRSIGHGHSHYGKRGCGREHMPLADHDESWLASHQPSSPSGLAFSLVDTLAARSENLDIFAMPRVASETSHALPEVIR